MRGVAAWAFRPDADILLVDRLARGWRPRPSALQAGPQILGHACKLAGAI